MIPRSTRQTIATRFAASRFLLLIALVLGALTFNSADAYAQDGEQDAGNESTAADGASDASTDDDENGVTAASTSSDGPPQRVIVEVSRFEFVQGVVELEDDTVIVVRDLKGEVHSFVKTNLPDIVYLVDPKPDQTGIVFLRNGQRRIGKIIKDDYDSLTFEIEGVRARLKRAQVHRVLLQPTFEEQYEEFKREITPEMVAGQLELCDWLIDQGRFSLAKMELEALLELNEIPRARSLLHQVEARLELISRQREVTETDDEYATDPALEVDLPEEYLSPEDVNLIRVYELDITERPLVELKAETIQKLIANYGSSELIPATEAGRKSMFRTDPNTRLNVVELMFHLRARELYSEIRVVHEPGPLNQFRRRVHDAWLIKNCATSACHGGVNAGRFFLYRRNHKDDRVRYSNLLILERLNLDPDWPLINYEDPERSLIIQYALPRRLARKPHPEVDGWSPVFDRSRSRLLDETVAWMKSMMYPRPEYPIDFDPPQVDGGFRVPERGDNDGRIGR